MKKDISFLLRPTLIPVYTAATLFQIIVLSVLIFHFQMVSDDTSNIVYKILTRLSTTKMNLPLCFAQLILDNIIAGQNPNKKGIFVAEKKLNLDKTSRFLYYQHKPEDELKSLSAREFTKTFVMV